MCGVLIKNLIFHYGGEGFKSLYMQPIYMPKGLT